MNASQGQMNRVDRTRLVESGGARDDSPSWNLGRAKQGDTIRVGGMSPRYRRQQLGASECSKHKAKPRTRARQDASPRSRQKVRRLDDCNRGREFHVSSKTTDNCVEPSVSQSIVAKRKLSLSEVDRMVQEAEKSRDEDEVNESKHEAKSDLEKFRVIV